MSTGELVGRLRRRHGLSQRALAVRARTSQAWISRVERGEVSPSIESLERLLRVMGEQLVLTSSEWVTTTAMRLIAPRRLPWTWPSAWSAASVRPRSPPSCTAAHGTAGEVQPGRDPRDARAPDPEDLARAANVSLDTREGELDVMNEAKGAPPFERLAGRAVVVESSARACPSSDWTT